MVLPLRTKTNIRFDRRATYGNMAARRCPLRQEGQGMMLLRTSYMLELIRDMINNNRSSTLREAYYISEGWGKAKFHSQDESNMLAEDLEIVTQCLREDFKLRPEEDGARVIGDLNIVETDRKGKRKALNCRDDVGDSGYGIPYNVEKEKVELVHIGQVRHRHRDGRWCSTGQRTAMSPRTPSWCTSRASRSLYQKVHRF